MFLKVLRAFVSLILFRRPFHSLGMSIVCRKITIEMKFGSVSMQMINKKESLTEEIDEIKGISWRQQIDKYLQKIGRI